MATVRAVKSKNRAKVTRQSRQLVAVAADAFKVINDGRTLARAAEMVQSLTDRAEPGYLSLRDLSARTWRGREGFGFWQHVARRSKKVRLTWLDWKELQAIHDLRESGVYASERLSQHVIAFQQFMALASLEVVEIARAVSDAERAR